MSRQDTLDNLTAQMQKYGFKPAKTNPDDEVTFTVAKKGRGRKAMRIKRLKNGSYNAYRGIDKLGNFDSFDAAAKKLKTRASQHGKVRNTVRAKRVKAKDYTARQTGKAIQRVAEATPGETGLQFDSPDEFAAMDADERDKILHAIKSDAWKGYKIGIGKYGDDGDEQELERAQLYAGVINESRRLLGKSDETFTKLNEFGVEPFDLTTQIFVSDGVGAQTPVGGTAGPSVATTNSPSAAPYDPTTEARNDSAPRPAFGGSDGQIDTESVKRFRGPDGRFISKSDAVRRGVVDVEADLLEDDYDEIVAFDVEIKPREEMRQQNMALWEDDWETRDMMEQLEEAERRDDARALRVRNFELTADEKEVDRARAKAKWEDDFAFFAGMEAAEDQKRRDRMNQRKRAERNKRGEQRTLEEAYARGESRKQDREVRGAFAWMNDELDDALFGSVYDPSRE